MPAPSWRNVTDLFRAAGSPTGTRVGRARLRCVNKWPSPTVGRSSRPRLAAHCRTCLVEPFHRLDPHATIGAASLPQPLNRGVERARQTLQRRNALTVRRSSRRIARMLCNEVLAHRNAATHPIAHGNGCVMQGVLERSNGLTVQHRARWQRCRRSDGCDRAMCGRIEGGGLAMPFTESLVRSERRSLPITVACKMSPRPRQSHCRARGSKGSAS
jgi:hypothetical protein